MTVSSPTRSVTYNGNSAATVFAYPFRVFDAADIVVTAISAAGTETIRTITTDYTVSGVDDALGGNITMLVAPATGTQLRIERVIAETQEVDFRSQGPTRAEVIETALDRLTMLVQQNVSDTELAAEVATAVAGLTVGSYNSVTATGGSTALTLQSRFGVSLSPRDFGGIGDRTADDTAAVVAAVAWATARGYGIIDLRGYTYRVTSTITVSGTRIKFIGDGGCFGGGLLKAHTGDLLHWTGTYGACLGVWLEADTATNVAFGTGGWAINFSSNSSAYGFRFLDGGVYNHDQMFRFALDAGHEFHCIGSFLQQYTTAAGSEPTSILTVGDTTAAFRSFIDVWFPSKADISGALDTKFIGCSIRTILGSASTSIVAVVGTIWANNNNPSTITGDNWLIQGCRFSGNVTLASGSNGTWGGNMFTFGVLVNSSGSLENWDILHRYEDSNHRYTFGPHQMRIGYAGMINPAAVTYHGDVAYTIFNTDTPTHIWTAVLTAGRLVTLSTGASMYNGEMFWIERAATATGDFDLTIGATGVTLRAGECCVVQYTGSLDSNSLYRVIGVFRNALLSVVAPSEAVLVSGVSVVGVGEVEVTLTAARVVGAPLNPRSGQRVVHHFLQDGTGGWAVTWNAVFKNAWVNTGNTANKRSTIEHYFNGTNWIQASAQTLYY